MFKGSVLSDVWAIKITLTSDEEKMLDKIKFIAKIYVSVYRMSLQLQIDDYINSTSIKQLGGK